MRQSTPTAKAYPYQRTNNHGGSQNRSVNVPSRGSYGKKTANWACLSSIIPSFHSTPNHVPGTIRKKKRQKSWNTKEVNTPLSTTRAGGERAGIWRDLTRTCGLTAAHHPAETILFFQSENFVPPIPFYLWLVLGGINNHIITTVVQQLTVRGSMHHFQQSDRPGNKNACIVIL